jgi:hypothetical protein
MLLIIGDKNPFPPYVKRRTLAGARAKNGFVNEKI